MFSSYFRDLVVAAALLITGPVALAADDDIAVATFAGGCFWSMEAAFDQVAGVVSTTTGYTGGPEETSAYKVTSSGGTRHAEAVKIEYDPDQVSYQALLRVFWVNHDPTTNDRQFCDKGARYRPVIFYHNTEQKRLAEHSRQQIVENHPFPVLTEITGASAFHAAEEHHQNYKEKNPIKYKLYSSMCGRAARLEELWGTRSNS